MPNDIANIKLALQGYNFGADVYFNYLEKNGITSWSRRKFKSFCRKMAKRRNRAFQRRSSIRHGRSDGTMEISIIRNMYFVTIIPKSLDSYKMFFINFSNFFEKTFDNYNYIWYYMSCR